MRNKFSVKYQDGIIFLSCDDVVVGEIDMDNHATRVYDQSKYNIAVDNLFNAYHTFQARVTK